MCVTEKHYNKILVKLQTIIEKLEKLEDIRYGYKRKYDFKNVFEKAFLSIEKMRNFLLYIESKCPIIDFDDDCIATYDLQSIDYKSATLFVLLERYYKAFYIAYKKSLT